MPLTTAQRRYWQYLLTHETGLSPLRNIAASLRLRGPLDSYRLEHSIQTVINRHEALRTRIAHLEAEKEPVQLIDPPHPLHLAITDLSHLDPAENEEIAAQLGREFFSEYIDLTARTVFDARLVKLAAQDYVLMLALDHIASDATSYPILTQEVLSIVTSGRDAAKAPTRQMPIQFPDYAVWHQKTADAWRQEHKAYWDAKLSPYSQVVIPTDRDYDEDPTASSNCMSTSIGPLMTSELGSIARRERLIVPIIFLSLYAIVMSHWCDRNDLMIGFLSHGRYGHPQLKYIIGCFAHPIFLRVHLTPAEHLLDLVARVAAELHASLARDPSHVLPASGDPTEVYFNWLPADWGLSGTSPSFMGASNGHEMDLRIDSFPVDKPVTTKFSPVFADTPSGVLIQTWYDTRLFFPSTIERFSAQLTRLIETFLRNPNTPLSSLDLKHESTDHAIGRL